MIQRSTFLAPSNLGGSPGEEKGEGLELREAGAATSYPVGCAGPETSSCTCHPEPVEGPVGAVTTSA